MQSPVVASLLPVVFLIAIGFIAAKRRWVLASGLKDISNLIFYVLTPALLFRTMGQVHLERLELKPLLVYFAAVALLFGGTLLWAGLNRRGAVLALAATFGNTVMIGISLVQLAYGDAGLVPMLTLVSLHALVLLTTATIVLEVAVAREKAALHGTHAGMAATVAQAVRNAIIHPVPLPILAGLAFAQTGWVIPAVLDRPLVWMGNAFGPLALLLVGISVAYTPVKGHFKEALGLAALKNVAHPLLMLAMGKLFGLQGTALVVMVVAASLPVGANVLLFAQRYGVAEELMTTHMALSTVLGLITVALTMALVPLV